MRSEDEILALVREKADGLQRRRRRLIGASGGIAAALLLVLGVAVASTTGRPNETTVTADNGMGSTERPTTTAVPSTTQTPTSTEESTSSTTMPAQPAGEAGHQPRPAGSHAPPPTTRTTTTTIAPPPLCPASAIEMVVTTDRSTYSPGEEVVMTAKATNHAGHDCAEADSSETAIRNQEGRQVYAMSSIGARIQGDWRWRAGETRTSEARWNQQSLTEHGNSAVPPGTYTVTVSWSAAASGSGERVTYASSASFTIEQP